MPYNHTVKRLRIDDREITEITVGVNTLATAEHRQQYPGAESCVDNSRRKAAARSAHGVLHWLKRRGLYVE